MIVKPKTNWDGNPLVQTYTGTATAESVVWVELEAVHPPSSAGRGVDLHMSEEEATALLLALRSALTTLRAKPEGATP